MDDNDALRQKSENSRSPKSKIRARCPACSTLVNLRDRAEVWDVVSCPSCNTLLEIASLRPPTLDYASAPDLEEDEWDDEEDWEEYKKR